jgi:sericin-1
LSTYFSSLLHFRCLNVHSDVERSLAVSVFRLDPDKFNQRLSQLESAGQKFDTAQHQFAVAAQAIAGATTGAGSSGRSSPPSGAGSSGSSSGSSSSGSGASGGEHWSGIGELDQFHSPLHSSVIVLDGKLSSISRNQKAAIERMRRALHSFLELNESEKSAYLGRLQALDTKFTYRRPEEMADIIKSYNQARSAFEAFSKIV